MRNPRFYSIGDNVIDRYLDKNIQYPGGNALNAATLAKRYGCECQYAGKIGDDPEGQWIRYALTQCGVGLDHAIFPSGSTTKRCDVIHQNGERMFVGVDYGDHWPGPMRIDDRLRDALKKADLIHLSCNAKMENELSFLRNRKAFVSYDFSAAEKYRSAAYLENIASNIDLAIFSEPDYDSDRSKHLVAITQTFKIGHCLITYGKSGQLYHHPCGIEVYNEGKNIDVVDTMGAGDAYIAAFLIEGYRQGLFTQPTADRKTITDVMRKATDFATANCLAEGSFGFGLPLSKEKQHVK